MRVTTKGFKAHDADHELAALTVLSGPNGSGKSTIADAVRFGALGYIPALGKRPVDTAVLMANGGLQVEISLDDGRTIARGLSRTDKGYTQTAEASWIRNAKPQETGKAILGLFGAEEQDVAECLDIRQLLAATPNQRASRLEQLLSAGQRPAEEKAAAVARLVVMRLADTTEERMPANYLQAMPMVPERQQQVLREIAGMLKAKIFEAGIPGALDWAKEEKNRAADGLKKKTAAEYELKKRTLEVVEPDEREISRLEAERGKLQRELGSLDARHGAWATLAQRRRGLEESLGGVRDYVDMAERQLVDAEAVHGKAIQDLEESRKTIAGAQAALKLPAAADYSKAEAIEMECREIAEQARAIEFPEVPTVEAAAAKVEAAQREIERAKSSSWSEVLEIAEKIADVCTTKGAKDATAKPLKRLRELARAGLGSDPEELKHALDLAKHDLSTLETKRSKAQKEQLQLSAQVDELNARERKRFAEAQQIRTAVADEWRKASEAYEARRRELLDMSQRAENQIETHRRALAAAREQKATVDRRQASLVDQLRGMGEAQEAPPDPKKVREDLAAVSQQLQRLVDARAVHKEIHVVLDSIEEAKAERDVYAGVEWALQRQREVEISEAGGPLLRTAREFLQAAGRREEPFIRAASGLCAIGWKTPEGREVQIQALSGGEWCVYAAALTAGVVLARPSAVKVLLVEAGECDEVHFAQLLAGIRKVADEGRALTAAIVMTPRAVKTRPEGWKVIETELQKATA
jgi:DNA repair exonuclease SbcCD ATPase subunit